MTSLVLMAMDRAPTARRYDAQGFLHLSHSNISKANVCPYHGREIPGWQELGLDGDRVYRLLRHPDELKAAAHTFDNLPILDGHIPVDADSIPDDMVVGSTGSQGAFDGRYLTNSLVIWKRGAIDGVESNRKRELSPGYRYTPDMTPGNYEGMQYDGIMRNLSGNHVALVIEGRTGPDVVVGDETTMKTRTALMVSGALAGLVRPLLAQDAQVDLTAPLADLSASNLGDGKTVAEAVVALASPHLAADKALDVATVQAAIAAVPTVALAEDALIVATSASAPAPSPTPAPSPAPVAAMDAAAVTALVDKARSDAIAEGAAMRTAERDVFPHVGDVAAMDSAEAVYKFALDQAKVDLNGVHPSAYRALVKMLPEPGALETPTLAADGALTGTNLDDLVPAPSKRLVRS